MELSCNILAQNTSRGHWKGENSKDECKNDAEKGNQDSIGSELVFRQVLLTCGLDGVFANFRNLLSV